MIPDDNEIAEFWESFSWDKARALLEMGPDSLPPIQHKARASTIQFFGPAIKFFQPGLKFPAISITGDQCALDCVHCNKRYLKSMYPARTPADLITLCQQLDDRGAIGCLISGGCDAEGSVPIGPFLDAIATIKQETQLVLNLHTGFLTPPIAARLGEIGIDVVSFDVNGSDETIQAIYRLNRKVSDYKQSLDLLEKFHVNFVPHICIGLHYGELKGEIDALEIIRDYSPNIIVFIVLIPPSQGPSKDFFIVPHPDNIAKVFCIARTAFPETELLLGCMRPGGSIRPAIEKQAIESGATSIVLPTRKTREWLVSQGVPIKVFSACCAIPPATYEKALVKQY